MRLGMKRTAWVAAATLMAAASAYTMFSGHAVNAQSGSRYGDAGGAYGSQTAVQQQSFEQRFWAYLQNAQYKNWAPVPGKSGDFYPGQAPHGKFLKMYLNRTAAGNMKDLPHGSIIVKENYGPNKQKLMAVTVMYRVKDYDPDNNDWYWVKYMPNGTVAKAPPEKGSKPIAGKFPSCINCHSGANGNDLAFVNDEG